MPDPISRRSFSAATTGLVIGSASKRAVAEDKPKPDATGSGAGPIEASFDRDYPPPGFKPSWKKPQINRLFVQDFVIYAHSELDMVKSSSTASRRLLNATVDWGNGDWESGLGGASHMGRRDIVEYLLDRGARIDIFCAAMMGQLDAVKSFLTLEPKLIDAKGPHGFTLHFHAQVGGKESEPVLDYLQSIKKIELKPNPFLKKAGAPRRSRRSDRSSRSAAPACHRAESNAARRYGSLSRQSARLITSVVDVSTVFTTNNLDVKRPVLRVFLSRDRLPGGVLARATAAAGGGTVPLGIKRDDLVDWAGSGQDRLALDRLHLSWLPPSLMLAPPSMLDSGYCHSPRICKRLFGSCSRPLARAAPHEQDCDRSSQPPRGAIKAISRTGFWDASLQSKRMACSPEGSRLKFDELD